MVECSSTPTPVESHVSTRPANCLTPFQPAQGASTPPWELPRRMALRRMSVSSKYRLRSLDTSLGKKLPFSEAKRGRRDPVSFTMNLLLPHGVPYLTKWWVRRGDPQSYSPKAIVCQGPAGFWLPCSPWAVRYVAWCPPFESL